MTAKRDSKSSKRKPYRTSEGKARCILRYAVTDGRRKPSVSVTAKKRMKKQKKREVKRVPWSMAAPFLKRGWRIKGMVGGTNNAFIAVLVKPDDNG